MVTIYAQSVVCLRPVPIGMGNNELPKFNRVINPTLILPESINILVKL